MTKKVGYYTLGCKLNYAETDAIARSMSKEGYERVDFDEQADYYVINTCTVTETANKKSRYAIRKAHKQNPNSKIIIVGCYAQLKPEEISEVEGVNLILGAKDKFAIPQLISQAESDQPVFSPCEIDEVDAFQSSYSLESRTRTFLKVQDGCDYKCSYCTIPYARGKSRNAKISDIISQAQEIASAGCKEIVLTGINIGDFGKSTGDTFLDLIKELDKVNGIERYRISSIEPNLLTYEIIDFVAESKKFMPHFHIPLQSGCNDVLKLMRRRYTTELFADKVKAIKERIPDACIGADVIVGTNGETQEYFEITKDFIVNLPISYLHVFTYSEREGTDALLIEHTVPVGERNERSKALHQISDRLLQVFYKQFDGETRPVLWEAKEKDGFVTGFSNNYVKVAVPAGSVETNTISEVKLSYSPERVLGV